MKNNCLRWTAATLFSLTVSLAEAQQPKIQRVGVIFQGGEWLSVIDGLRDALKQLGLVEGRQFLLDIRDAHGDLKAVAEAANSLEQDNVDLLYTVATSVTDRSQTLDGNDADRFQRRQ